MTPVINWNDDYKTPEERREEDERKTGRIRCIGCGRFVAKARHWNQCADCDVRVAGIDYA